MTMELGRDIFTLLLGILGFLLPLIFVPLLQGEKSVMIFVVAVMIFSGMFCLTLLWWDDASTWWLMEYYGWDPNGMCDSEYYQNVAECDRERVQKLWNHNMGVGWPVKAFLVYLFLFPLQLILSAIVFLFVKHYRIHKIRGYKES